MAFVLPHEPHLRPAWMIRAGLFLYDHLGTRNILPGSKGLSLKEHPYGSPLKNNYKKAFSYADCWVDDARLVILNAMDARERGAKILTRTACTKLEPSEDHWTIHLQSMLNRNHFKATAKMVVNAAGPWVKGVLESSGLDHENTPDIKLVKGSHIIVPQLYEGDQSYILQQPDGRIVFAIPYEHKFTLIGTTEIEFDFDPTTAQINESEINYLCDAINRSFDKQIDAFGPILLNVFGGKITTYRKLSEKALNMLSGKKSWTGRAPLPGGNIPYDEFEEFVERKQKKYNWCPPELINRYARAYGTRLDEIIGSAKSLDDMGRAFGHGLYENEVRYLIDKEWAWTTEDILWRRTKLGLHVDRKTVQNLEAYMAVSQERIYAT
jgi:glycerol-3-phosphate dehydrogenase